MYELFLRYRHHPTVFLQCISKGVAASFVVCRQIQSPRRGWDELGGEQGDLIWAKPVSRLFSLSLLSCASKRLSYLYTCMRCSNGQVRLLISPRCVEENCVSQMWPMLFFSARCRRKIGILYPGAQSVLKVLLPLILFWGIRDMCCTGGEIPVLYFLASPPFLSPNGNFGAYGWIGRYFL